MQPAVALLVDQHLLATDAETDDRGRLGRLLSHGHVRRVHDAEEPRTGEGCKLIRREGPSLHAELVLRYRLNSHLLEDHVGVGRAGRLRLATLPALGTLARSLPVVHLEGKPARHQHAPRRSAGLGAVDGRVALHERRRVAE
eukprot:6143798-Prymnesium_polylepis.3